MKYVAMFVLALMLAFSASAQTIEQKVTTVLTAAPSTAAKITAIHDLLQVASDTRKAQKAELLVGTAKYEDVEKQSANYVAAVDRHNAEIANFDARMKSQNDRADSHNANRCQYYDGHAQDCAAYTAEEQSLNAEGAALNAEKIVLNRAKDNLDAAKSGLAMMVADYNKWRDDFTNRVAVNEHSIDVLMKILAGLQKANASCTDVLHDPKSTDEQVHEACSKIIDGNGTKPPLVNQGTGGGSQNR